MKRRKTLFLRLKALEWKLFFKKMYVLFFQEYSRDASCHELDLNGVPWTQNSSYSLHGRSMMLRLLREAHINGWRLAASADVSAKYVHQVEIRQLRI